MSEKNENLNEAELAAIDSMIAYLQHSDKKTMDKTLDGIYANSNCFNGITAPIFAVAIPGIANNNDANSTFVTSTCITGLIGVGAGGLKQGTPKFEAFFEKLANGKPELTLDELIALRNDNK